MTVSEVVVIVHHITHISRPGLPSSLGLKMYHDILRKSRKSIFDVPRCLGGSSNRRLREPLACAQVHLVDLGSHCWKAPAVLTSTMISRCVTQEILSRLRA